MFLEHLQGWWLHHLPGQPIPASDRILREVLPNVQPESPLVQLEAMPSSPIASYMGEQADSHPTTTSLHVIVESDKVSSEFPLLQTEQSQFPQQLPTRPVLQTLSQACCSSPDMLQGLNVFLVLRGPKVSLSLALLDVEAKASPLETKVCCQRVDWVIKNLQRKLQKVLLGRGTVTFS